MSLSFYLCLTVELNSCKERELSCGISLASVLFQLYSYWIELLQRGGTFLRVKFQFAPFHPQNWAYPHAHMHKHTHIHMHTWTLADVRCLLLSITEVWVTSDEVNSIMGKKSVIFKEKWKEKKKRWKSLNLTGTESLWGQRKYLNLPDLNLSIVFIIKNKKGIWLGHGECLNSSNIWIVIQLGLTTVISGLDFKCTMQHKWR